MSDVKFPTIEEKYNQLVAKVVYDVGSN